MSQQSQNPYKAVLKLAWPLIIANSFWNLQMTIDRIFLGIHSTEALGASMAVLGVFWVPMALLQQTASYVTTFVAQYYGAKDSSKINSAVWQATWVSILGGVIFVFFNFFTEAFFRMVGHSPSVQVLEVDYFNALSWSALPTALVAVASGYFTGLGLSQRVIWINLVGLLGNALFDYLLIFGHAGFPVLGVKGAGYATAIGNYFAAFVGFVLVARHRIENSKSFISEVSMNWGMMKQFLKFGIPSGMQWALEGLAFTVFMIILGRHPQGEVALAASSVAMTVMMLSVLPSMGVAQAVMTFVGQFIGKKRSDNAEIYTWVGVKLSSCYMIVMGLSFALFPEFYLSWFENKENPELWGQVVSLGMVLLKIVAIFSLFDSIFFNISFALKGAGDTRFVSAVALILPWPLMVLPAYLLQGRSNSIEESWLSAVVYALVANFVLWRRFKGGKWKSMSVIST